MIKIYYIMVSVFLFSCSCKQKMVSGEKFREDVQELNVASSYYQKWIAGVRGGGSGLDVYVTFKQALDKDVAITKMQIFNLESYSVDVLEDGKSFAGRFTTGANRLELHADGAKEYGNDVPQKTTKDTLAQGTVRIYYKKGDSEYATLIHNVKEKELIPYPSARPRN